MASCMIREIKLFKILSIKNVFQLFRFDLSWKLPTRANEDGDRISVYETNDQLTVTIHNLQDDDSGIYICELQNKGIRRTKKITVYVRSSMIFFYFQLCNFVMLISYGYLLYDNLYCILFPHLPVK